MLLKIKQWIKSLFSFRFVHPLINDKLSTAIDDKLSKRVRAQNDAVDHYNRILNMHLRTYFSKQYESPELMQAAFNFTNKEWHKLARDVNSTNKLINLDKEAFKKRVELTVKHFKESQTKN